MRPASCPQVRSAGQTDGTATPLSLWAISQCLWEASYTGACSHAHVCCLHTRACLHTRCISGTCHRESRARKREREGILDSYQVFRTRVGDRCNKVYDHTDKFSIFAQCKSHHLAPVLASSAFRGQRKTGAPGPLVRGVHGYLGEDRKQRVYHPQTRVLSPQVHTVPIGERVGHELSRPGSPFPWHQWPSSESQLILENLL